MPAADTIDVRLLTLTRGVPILVTVLAWVVWAVLLLGLILISSLIQVPIADLFMPTGVRTIQLVHRSTREVVVEGRSPPFRSKRLAALMIRDAERLDEPELLAKWGDPKNLHRILGTERY